jgi:uncharacterized protein (TIGR00645 family)
VVIVPPLSAPPQAPEHVLGRAHPSRPGRAPPAAAAAPAADYLGLIVGQCVYVFQFLKELVELVAHTASFTEQQIMLSVLGLIDVVMISNLLVMVIVGGYETFVSRLGLAGHPDQPEWFSHVNAGILKVKLAMAIVGISSIHLLRTFIETSKLGKEGANVTAEGIMWQTIIHGLFVLSAIGIAFVDRLSEQKPHHG